MTAVKDSVTGYCAHGQHHRCPYRPGAACHGGITLIGGSRYDCPCDCHQTADRPGQLELFGVAS